MAYEYVFNTFLGPATLTDQAVGQPIEFHGIGAQGRSVSCRQSAERSRVGAFCSLSMLLALVALSCARTREEHVEAAYPGAFPEQIGPTWETPGGIAVDGVADPEAIDATVDSVFECLRSAVPDRLTRSETIVGLCYADDGLREPFRYPARSDLVVKIGKWHPSCANPKRQVLDVEVPERFGCDPNKPPPPGCETNRCYWRGGYRYVKDRAGNWVHLHVAVPKLSMLADTLVRSITACNDPYSIQRIRSCTHLPQFPE